MSKIATESRWIPRLLMSPAVVTLLIWMLVPLAMTIYFSLIRFNLMSPEISGFSGWENYNFFVTNPAFWDSIYNTLILLGSVVVITVGFGLAIAFIADKNTDDIIDTTESK